MIDSFLEKKKWIEINLSYMYALLWIGKNHFEWSLHLTLYQKPWKLTENSVHLYFITCIHIWFYKIVFISAADKQEYYINVHRSLDQNKKMYVEFFKNKKKSTWLSTCSLADIEGRVEKPSGKFFNEQYTRKLDLYCLETIGRYYCYYGCNYDILPGFKSS